MAGFDCGVGHVGIVGESLAEITEHGYLALFVWGHRRTARGTVICNTDHKLRKPAILLSYAQVPKRKPLRGVCRVSHSRLDLAALIES